MMPNFFLHHDAPLARPLLEKGISDFAGATAYVRMLPYRRNADKKDLSCIIKDSGGTCSTKHAYLSALAAEHGRSDIRLMLGIYQMHEDNTPGVGKVLEVYNLPYILEAHTYLRHEGYIYDYTTNHALPFASALITEKEITPEQITDYKVQFHRAFLTAWVLEQELPYNLEEIWHIREACIAALSQADTMPAAMAHKSATYTLKAVSA